MILHLMAMLNKLLALPHLSILLRRARMLNLPNSLTTKKGKQLDYIPSMRSKELGLDVKPSHLTTTKLVVLNPREPQKKMSDSKTHLLLKMCLLRGGL